MYRHPEAFCLMKYRDDSGHEEWIWNARDGVTPFMITGRHGAPAEHVDWKEDRRDPNYDPPLGSRIFVDLTLEYALERARGYVEKFWTDSDNPMAEHFTSKDEAVGLLANAEMNRGGAPMLVDVTEGVLAWVRKQRELRKQIKE